MNLLAPWWELRPERLEYELESLRVAGIPFERDEESFARGTLSLRLHPIVDGEPLELIVEFPDIYPYARFEIRAPGLDLPHHQHPFGKNLCLIGRRTGNWEVTDTLATFVQERVPIVLRAGRSQEAAAVSQDEEHQGEPFSDYYSYEDDAIVLVDSAWTLDPRVEGGELTVGVEVGGQVLRGAVLAVRDTAGQTMAQADSSLRELYPAQIVARWVRCGRPIAHDDPETFLATLDLPGERRSQPLWQPFNDGRIAIVGVVFPEEVGWRENKNGWIFVARTKGPKVHGKRSRSTHLIRAGRAGRRDLAARVPELGALAVKKLTVIGLGGLGAPSAIALARSGIGELRIVDGDWLDAGTVVRWPLGVAFAGRRKAQLLHGFIRPNFPYTQVKGWVHRIGISGEGGDRRVLSEALAGIDLLYDATAELGIQYFLSDLALEFRLPYICVSTTAGAWGGLVARIRPDGGSGCWLCLQHALDDKSIPTPPADPDGGVQPEGCASPTFTGAGFDVEQIALGGVRLAVATLSAGAPAVYPDFMWDVAVISLRDPDGRPIAPSWQTFRLSRHPRCERCGRGG